MLSWFRNLFQHIWHSPSSSSNDHAVKTHATTSAPSANSEEWTPNLPDTTVSTIPSDSPQQQQQPVTVKTEVTNVSLDVEEKTEEPVSPLVNVRPEQHEISSSANSAHLVTHPEVTMVRANVCEVPVGEHFLIDTKVEERLEPVMIQPLSAEPVPVPCVPETETDEKLEIVEDKQVEASAGKKETEEKEENKQRELDKVEDEETADEHEESREKEQEAEDKRREEVEVKKTTVTETVQAIPSEVLPESNEETMEETSLTDESSRMNTTTIPVECVQLKTSTDFETDELVHGTERKEEELDEEERHVEIRPQDEEDKQEIQKVNHDVGEHDKDDDSDMEADNDESVDHDDEDHHNEPREEELGKHQIDEHPQPPQLIEFDVSQILPEHEAKQSTPDVTDPDLNQASAAIKFEKPAEQLIQELLSSEI
ncbi:unnamed protein product [Echinostoma caproni]|uniref:Glutamic acid-rich protein-like n=1 Tax=Echinostoma caproni TaxID=27848 RepID=A0A183AU70_9TREM|nr:unnamed protein product [Echinostoma caproni]